MDPNRSAFSLSHRDHDRDQKPPQKKHDPIFPFQTQIDFPEKNDQRFFKKNRIAIEKPLPPTHFRREPTITAHTDQLNISQSLRVFSGKIGSRFFIFKRLPFLKKKSRS